MSPVLQIFTVLVVLACLVEAGIFIAVIYVNRRAAAANRVRKLAGNWQDFNDHEVGR